MDFADLHQLQQDGTFGQVGNDDLGVFLREPLDMNVQLRRPLAFKLFPRELQAFVGGRSVTQSGARQNHGDQCSDDGCDQGDKAEECLQRRTLNGGDPGVPMHIWKWRSECALSSGE